MYHFEHDPERGLLVSRMAAGGDEQADFGIHLEKLEQALTAAAARGQKLALVILFDSGHAVPNAVWRRAVADFQKRPIFNPDVVLVSGNPLLRGVLTALDWLRGSIINMQPAASGEKAVELIEKQRGAPHPQLLAMVRRVQSS